MKMFMLLWQTEMTRKGGMDYYCVNKPHWLPICPAILVYSYKFNSILKQMYPFICRYACLRPGMYQSFLTSNLSLKPSFKTYSRSWNRYGTASNNRFGALVRKIALRHPSYKELNVRSRRPCELHWIGLKQLLNFPFRLRQSGVKVSETNISSLIFYISSQFGSMPRHV